ncbi:MAG: hypothetical protein RLZZ165_1663, partial [Bacteroidota bacterium]
MGSGKAEVHRMMRDLGHIVEDINSSEYLYHYHKVKLSPAPYVNLEEEVA